MTGTADAPRINGRFQVLDGSVLHQPFGRAYGNIALAGGTVALNGVEVHNGKGKHWIDGKVSLSGNRAIDLAVKTQAARAEDIVALLAPGEPLTGNIENEVVLTGTLDEIDARGKLTLWEGSYRGYLLTKASGAYRRQGGILSLDNFQSTHSMPKQRFPVRWTGSSDSSSALMRKKSKWLTFSCVIHIPGKETEHGRTIDWFACQAGIPGRSDFAQTKPERTGDLFDIGGSVLLRRNEVQISAVHFVLGKGQVRASGGYRETDGEVYGGLSVENTDINSLLAILNTPLAGVAGRLDGQIALTGTTTLPALQLFGTLHGGRIKGYLLIGSTWTWGCEPGHRDQ